MRKLLMLLLFFLLPFASFSQNLLAGRIIDSTTGKPLPFVNIGVIGKNVGTVSGDDGMFRLRVPESNMADTLRISMVGYRTRTYVVKQYYDQFSGKDLALQEAVYQLPSVIVSNKTLKEKILGNKSESMNTTAGFTSGQLGNEIGMLIKINKSPTFVRKFAASVATDNNDPIRMRLNFYSVKNGLPDQPIHNRNIIVNAPRKNGKFEIDLSKYNIVAEDDFFVTLEWIEQAKGRFHFSSSLLGSPLVSRTTSQGKWQKVGMFGVGFTLLVAY